MIVVSDTSPLNYLVLIGAIDVLPGLFTRVYVPPSVISELTRTKTPDLVRNWFHSPPTWLQIVAPNVQYPFTAKLDAGEADALSLAIELQIREVLIDERLGRHVAAREGLIPLPTLTVLEFAATKGLLELPLALQKLQQTTFRAPADMFAALLARDIARKRRN